MTEATEAAVPGRVEVVGVAGRSATEAAGQHDYGGNGEEEDEGEDARDYVAVHRSETESVGVGFQGCEIL